MGWDKVIRFFNIFTQVCYIQMSHAESRGCLVVPDQNFNLPARRRCPFGYRDVYSQWIWTVSIIKNNINN